MSSFCKCKSYSHFFSKNISICAIFNIQSFNDMLMTLLVLNAGPRLQWLFSSIQIAMGYFLAFIVSLMSLLMIKMLTVLVSTIYNSQVFLLKKNVSSFCRSYSHFFNKNISIYVIFNIQNFNEMLINNFVSFEQLGPDCNGYFLAFRLQWLFSRLLQH